MDQAVENPPAGEKLRIDRTTMVKLVDDLERHALVERRRDPNDRRAYALSLSANGQAMLPEISQHAIEVEHMSLASLEQAEIKQLFQILLKLLKEIAGDDLTPAEVWVIQNVPYVESPTLFFVYLVLKRV